MVLLIAGVGLTPGVQASFQVPQIALDGTTVGRYLTALPHFAQTTGAVPRVPAGSALAISYHEFQQKVLPDIFYDGLPLSINPYPGINFNPKLGTYVWGFKVGGAPQLYPGVTVEAQKGTATAVTYTNNLGTATVPPILQRYITVDQTLVWANPLGLVANNPARFAPYSGPQPVVPHLHGGEVRSDSDGGPDEWWTPGGEGILSTPTAPGGIRGPGYYKNVFDYPNAQEAATIWFHDHALGVTRTNVYAGIAAFWFVRDQFDTGTVGTGLNLPAGPQEIEIVFQDRQFDTNGQWLFPDGYPEGLNGPPTNPETHPFWNPEFFGDVIVVNGRSWPFLDVEPRRYRFRLLNGSNARVYEMRVDDTTIPATPVAGPPIYVIGTDGGLLDAPAITSSTTANRLIIASGERYDVIIDFTAFAGKTLTIMNTANGPFPGGPIVPDPLGTAELMQFRVSPTAVADTSFDPATSGCTLRGGADKPPAIVPLVNGAGGINPAVTLSKKRQLVLREIMGPGGPLEVLVNNTLFNGTRGGTVNPIPGSSRVGVNWLTELPQIGSTEEWEIINFTADAHPIHLHMIQFQVMNRQVFDDIGYTAAYEALFPAGAVIDGYGPPMDYNTVNFDGAIGGNPAVGSFLGVNPIQPPLPQEKGWKDTVLSYPGEVTRIIARWAPQDVALNAVKPGQNLFPFDPTYGPGYVWHCHIIDHEDSEMMRPYIPTKKADNTFAKFGGEIPGIVEPLLLMGP
jgi:FtsP/CotA-like multicopper oxidase with cupredoxin domain